MKGVITFGKNRKLGTRYLFPYKIMIGDGIVSYKTELSIDMEVLYLVFFIFY